MDEKQLFELTANKSVEDIQGQYSNLELLRTIFRESCRKYLSRFLMDTDEEHPYECDITLEYPDGFGMSSLEYPNLVRMWQDKTEGYIGFEIDGMGPIMFESIRDDELIQIINSL